MAPDDPAPPTDDTLRSVLGRLLKEQRDEAKLNQHHMVEVLGRSQSTVSKIEQGETSISREGLLAWTAACGTGPETVAEMVRLCETANAPARLRGSDRVATPAWFAPVIAHEQRARTILSWTGERINGLLQSEAYMLLVFDGARRGTVMAERLLQRKKRQRMFDEPGRSFLFVVSESALDRLCAQPADIAEDQLAHMLKLAGRENITIRFLRYRATPDPGPDFVIMQFAGEERDQAYSEDISNAHWVNKDQLPTWHRAWEALLDLADSAEDTLAELRDRCHRTASGDTGTG
ncbi:helix-turn-helix domain-containing protein [Amycolatopsis sp. NPDC088138]|uniref:helix-turn-helix domain-containing protein n=1 Tax=Amycolatopsis sp. NPDC088138 TaxID=3363938 RepID=UPI0037FD6397